MDEVWNYLDHFNQILGVVGFIISIISYKKIKKVDEHLNKQKEQILFNKKHKTFIKQISSYLSLLEKDGVDSTIVPILDLCDKICRYTGGFSKKDLEDLNEHINNIQNYNSNHQINVHSELSRIKTIIESVGEKNVL